MSLSTSLSERGLVDHDAPLDPPTSPGLRATRTRSASRSGRGLPRAARLSLGVVLAATAVLYIAGLSASGYANPFYSAAAQAGSTSWKAWFFGSLDAGNSITVDKPPAALWIMGLSVRLFGLSSWSILVPEALMGVASVGALYAAVRRSLGFDRATGSFRPTMRAHWAALAGAVVFALTPAATLMFRFNNPDALLVLLETLASYFVIRATETASRAWLSLAGVAIGFGFLTKMLQAFIVLPAFVVAYAVAAPATWRRKVVDLLVAFGAMVGALGWYVAVVELTPASLRPYIGGSQTNSFLELVFGYNGFGRITGNETGSVGGGGGTAGGAWGSTGLTRMFDGVSGGMIAWLIPAALLLTVTAYLVLGRHAWTTALRRRPASPATQANAGIIVYTGWLVVTALVFSYMAGIYHDYYTVALAPAVGGAVAIAGAVAWQYRRLMVARVGMAAGVSASSLWALVLLMRAGGWYTALGVGVAAVGTLAALVLLVVDRLPRLIGRFTLIVALIAVLAGPTSYSLQTASTGHSGSIVTAGPVTSSTGPAGGRAGGRGGFAAGGMPPGMTGNGFGGGTTGGTGTAPSIGQAPGGLTQGGRRFAGGQGGMGGLLDGASVSGAMTTLLEKDAGAYTWVAATVGSQNSASYQLATGDPVMAIGGFNGSDPSPTLAQFQELVAANRIHYFIGGGGFGGQNGGSNSASEIAAWVEQNFTAQTVGGVTVYDLTQSV